MNSYTSNVSVSINIPLADEDGNIYYAQSVYYKVLDESENIVVDWTQITAFNVGDTAVDIDLTEEQNTLPTGKTSGLRLITIKVIDDSDDEFYINYNYILKDEFPLQTGVNSYQTMGEAIVNAFEIPDAIGWDNSVESAKLTALIEAYHRIGRLAFDVSYAENTAGAALGYGGVNIVKPNSLSKTELEALPAAFLAALRKAQVSEADIILGGDPVQRKREEGILSDSVGESSIMFRPGKPMSLSLSRRTFGYLAGYIVYNKSLGRS